MVWAALSAALGFGLAAAYAFVLLRTGRSGAVWPVVLAAIAMVHAVPPSYPRIVLTGLSIVMVAKAFELARGRVCDPAMLARGSTFLVWFVIPPDAWTPASPEQARAVRKRGQGRLGRGALKAAVIVTLLGLSARYPELHRHGLLAAQWALWMTYCGLSGLADVVTGLVMQRGIDVAEVFDAPPLARSPRDFWGRRWNLYIHEFARRHVFEAWGGRRHPLRATMGVFLASGLMHEYLVFMSLGHPPRHVGFMMLFFALQGLAVVAELALRLRTRTRPLPRPVGIVLHAAWMTATAPLFFAPLAEMFTFPAG